MNSPLRRRLRNSIPIIVLIVGGALSLFVFFAARTMQERHARSVLELRADWRSSDLISKLRDAAVPLGELANLASVQKDIAEEDYRRFAIQARANRPVDRLAWAPVEHAGEAATLPLRFEATFDGEPMPAGTDLIADPHARRAFERARDEGIPIALPQAGNGADFLIFWPVYADTATPDSAAARRSATIGAIVGEFHADRVLAFAMRDTPGVVETLSLFIDPAQESAAAPPAAVYDVASGMVRVGTEALGGEERGGLRMIRSAQQFGANWRLVFDFTPAAVASLQSAAPWSYLLLALALTLLLASYLAIERRHHERIEGIVASRTRDLRQTTLQLRAIIESSPLAIGYLDPELRVMAWNRAAEEVFGYRTDEILGKSYYLLTPPGERAVFDENFARVAHGEVLRGVEVRRARKDGTVFEARVCAAPFHEADGRLQGVVFAIEDVTERNRAQQQLERAQKMEAIGQLTGGLAHDFNNILAVIIGNLDLIHEELRPASAIYSYCDDALAAALSAAELVKRLLAFSRRQPLRPEPTDLAEIVENMRPLLKRTLGEQIRMEFRTAPVRWLAIADPSQIENAILNLAVNARDAMPNGGVLAIEQGNVEVDAEFAAAVGDLPIGQYVVIAVSDTGHGMTPDIAARAFDPFFTTKPVGSGSGLGLSMVIGTIKQLGGTAKIYSEPGVGTTVRLYLPRARSASETSEAPN
ncbi:MAG TPA: PAS domain S-box protein, partial [Rudaea sp.]